MNRWAAESGNMRRGAGRKEGWRGIPKASARQSRREYRSNKWQAEEISVGLTLSQSLTSRSSSALDLRYTSAFWYMRGSKKISRRLTPSRLFASSYQRVRGGRD